MVCFRVIICVGVLLATHVALVAEDACAEETLASEALGPLTLAPEMFTPGTVDPDRIRPEGPRREALDVFEQVRKKLRPEGLLRDIRPKGLTPIGERKSHPRYRILIFASLSLGDKALSEMMRAIAGHDDEAIVFRGIPDGTTLPQGVMALMKPAKDISPVPNVMIDPTLFEKFAVTSAPTIIILDSDGQGANDPDVNDARVNDASVLARVEGLGRPAWLEERVDRDGKRGDLGVRGPVAEISEPDLLEVMKRRLAMIDWEAKKRHVLDNYWKTVSFITLPATGKPRIRTIDPSIEITRDIKDSEGNVIVKAGTRINPLDMRPFTERLVIFDPLDKVAMTALDRRLARMPDKDRATIKWIATRIDRQDGWDSLKRIGDDRQAPIYLLTPDLVRRFALEHAPSIVTAADKKFIVEEVGGPEK